MPGSRLSTLESSSITRRTASVAQHLQPARLTQQDYAKRVVQLRVGQDDPFDRDVAVPGGGGRGQSGELRVHVGRGVQQEPAGPVGTDGGRRLASRDGPLGIGPGHTAGRAPAVPLGEPPAGGGAEKNDVHWSEDGGWKD